MLGRPTKRGNELHPEDQAEVLRSYVHRFTGQHRPRWATKPRPDGRPYPVQFADDAEWLANTEFSIRGDGRLDRRDRNCYSRPTWPNNPELRKKP